MARRWLHRLTTGALVALLLSSVPYVAVLRAALATDLVSCWTMDAASGTDSVVASANDLTPTGVASAAAVVSTGGDFEAGDANDNMQRTDHASLSGGDRDFTIAGWVNFETVATIQHLLSKFDATNGEYHMSLMPDGALYFKVYSAAAFGGTATTATWGSNASGATNYYVMGGHNATANEIWVSVNGGTPVTAAHSAGVYDSTAPFWFSNSSFSDEVDGVLDEWAFWSRDARADRTALYNGGAGMSCAAIIADTGGAAAPCLRSLLGVGCE